MAKRNTMATDSTVRPRQLPPEPPLNSPAWYDWVELKTHWEGDETPKQTRQETKP